MSNTPSPNGQNGCGNPGGPGNPFAKRVGELRSLLLESVTDDDLRVIIRGMVDRAKAGDAIATREVLDRLLGRSVQAIALDARLDVNAESEPVNSGPVFVAQMMRDYAELGIPRASWSPMVSAPYERWRRFEPGTRLLLFERNTELLEAAFQ